MSAARRLLGAARRLIARLFGCPWPPEDHDDRLDRMGW